MYMYLLMHVVPSSVVIPSSASFLAAAGLREKEGNEEIDKQDKT